ncbi:hypothetical protein D3C76_1738680 [compost metagenome]
MGMGQNNPGDRFTKGLGGSKNPLQTKWHPRINDGYTIFFFHKIDVHREKTGEKGNLDNVMFTS